MHKLQDAAEVEARLDELVPRRSAGTGLCRNELDLNGFTCSRGDLKKAVQNRRMKAGTHATAYSDSAELKDVDAWIERRIGASDSDLLKSPTVIQQVMRDLGFYVADPAVIQTAVIERRQRWVDGDDE
jgi:hypothetical protein